MDKTEIRLECLKLGAAPTVPPHEAVARAQMYLDFVLEGTPDEKEKPIGPIPKKIENAKILP